MIEQNYLQLLIQSLEKKITVLDHIIQLNDDQKNLLVMEEVDLDEWNGIIEEKAKSIDQINFLDEGFEEVYNRVKDLLSSRREEFQEEIRILQGLIGKVTDRSVQVQTGEQRNKELAQLQFGKIKKKLRTVRQTSQAVQSYSNSMKKLNFVDAQFLDKKK
jgi:hypothetical protein